MGFGSIVDSATKLVPHPLSAGPRSDRHTRVRCWRHNSPSREGPPSDARNSPVSKGILFLCSFYSADAPNTWQQRARDEHSFRESYLYYKQLHATDSAVALISINLRSAFEVTGPLTWQRRARDEHSFRESYLITVAEPPFYTDAACGYEKSVPVSTSCFGPIYMF